MEDADAAGAATALPASRKGKVQRKHVKLWHIYKIYARLSPTKAKRAWLTHRHMAHKFLLCGKACAPLTRLTKINKTKIPRTLEMDEVYTGYPGWERGKYTK